MPEPLTLPPELAETHELVRDFYKDSTQLHHEFIRRKSDQKSDGFYRAFYPNGQLWCEEIRKNNNVWETIQDFMPDGTPVTGSGLKNGDGHLKVFSVDGSLSQEGDCKDGMYQGHWRYFHKNGRVKCEGDFIQGKQHGEWLYFYENGNPESKGSFEHNKREGETIYHHENGAEKSRGIMQDGQKQGIWRYHDEKGNYIGEETFVDGKHHGPDRTLYPDGTLAADGSYENDRRVGTWRRYHPSGKLDTESDYKADPVSGYTRIFDESSGRLTKEGPISYDEELKKWGWSGIWRFYESDGRVLYKVFEYKNNEVKTLRAYFDPAPLQKILQEEPVETQHKSMLAAMKGSPAELYKSLEALVEQGATLSVELAVLMALAAPQEALGRVSTLLLPHQEAALRLMKKQPKDQTEWPACAALILSLHALQPEEIIDESYDLCLGQALYWAHQKKCAIQELGAVLKRIPIERREELVFQRQPSQPLQDNRLLIEFAEACQTPRVLQALLSITLSRQSYQLDSVSGRDLLSALTSFGEAAVIPVEQALKSTKKQATRRFLVGSLAKSKSMLATKTLFAYLDRKNAAIVTIARDGLVSMGDALLPTLESYILGKAQGRSKHAATILKAMPQTEASQKVLAALQSKAKGEARIILTA